VRRLRRALTVALVVAALVAASAYRGLQASRAERSGTLTLAGLEAPVEIRFDARARPWGGDHASVGRARYRYDRPERVNSGATVRVVIEMSDPMNVSAILPGGQAGHPSDPHYADQLEPWLRGEQDLLWRSFDEATGPALLLDPAAKER